MSLTFTTDKPTTAGNFYFRTDVSEGVLLNIYPDENDILRAAVMLPANWNYRPVFALADLEGEWALAD